LVSIYAFSVAGVAVKADYCCNYLKSVKLVLADGTKDSRRMFYAGLRFKNKVSNSVLKNSFYFLLT